MDWTETRQGIIAAGVSAAALPLFWQLGINLTGADLRGADLRGADLTGADLTGASGPFATGSFGCHNAVAAGGYISIGCERHTYAEWLKRYEEIGDAHDYSAAEVAMYGRWISMAVAWLEPIEAEIAAAKKTNSTRKPML
jgi:hypothetical protein